MSGAHGARSMVAPLARLFVKRPEEAFGDAVQIDAAWRCAGWRARPDTSRAVAEHRQLVALLEHEGAEVLALPADDATGLDSIYTHDPVALVTERGAILGRPGKSMRVGEVAAFERAFAACGTPVTGRIVAPGTLEGGDLLWLDGETLAVGRGYRTNAAGIAQLRALVAEDGVRVLEVPLVHWGGPEEVLHLQSLISLVDVDLAVVDERLLPIPFRELLLARGVQLLALPETERASLGANVLAMAPRRVVIFRGNPGTANLLRRSEVVVHEVEGLELGQNGSGGPTCLTRPVLRR